MALKNVATTAYSREVNTIVGSNVVVDFTMPEIGVPSDKVKADGNWVLEDGFEIEVLNVTDPGSGASIPDAGPFTAKFNTTATKVRTKNGFVLRVDDETDIISATPRIPGNPSSPYPVQFTIKITDAGQDKVKAV